ncbi:MAG: alpha/beta hydrolase fold domain-containing protein [Saprospiraceae bacterium]|nr:alpha/beta hydrolase fold domain-containing protein [Saprospiraceae bacterium]MDW8485267.1 alpha/beta hydrolase fold domain-containing protein [Saprospiraceae bacterium]
MRDLLIGLCCTLVIWPVLSQNSTCDGIRYKSPVFAHVQKTTVPYATAVNQLGQLITLFMDVYEPQGDTARRRPVVILAHGGSFVFGNKADMARWCDLIAKRGFVAASIQYRLYPIFPLGFPDSLKIMDTAVKAMGDMKAAVRYFREDAATLNRFRVDSAHIFVGGYSAGAVIALHTAFVDEKDDIPPFMRTLISNNGGLNGNSGSPSNQQYSSSVRAVLNLSGGMYRRSWISKGEPPMASIHGTDDATVPYTTGLAAGLAYLEGSGVLHPQALNVDVWSYLKAIPGGGHTNIYEDTAYAQSLAEYWTRACALLEHLTCHKGEPGGASASSDADAEKFTWRIFPNPVQHSEAFVQITDADLERFFELVLYDLQGREVLRKRLKGSGLHSLNFSELAAGIYLAWLSDAARRGSVQKILRY